LVCKTNKVYKNIAGLLSFCKEVLSKQFVYDYTRCKITGAWVK